MIEIVLGSPGRMFRHELVTHLCRYPDLELVAATGEPGRLCMLATNSHPSLVVLDACWLQSSPRLLGRVVAGPLPPRILLCADDPTAPEVLWAVEQGVHGCLAHDAEPSTWHRAIRAIHAGDTWIPRWLMAKALANLKQQPPTARAVMADRDRLTERQCEIVGWVAQGLSNKEIGRRLDISPTTVKTHLQNIFERAGVHGRQQLALRALGHHKAA